MKRELNGSVGLDALTRKHTAFGSFAEMTEERTDYFPSLYCNGRGKRNAEVKALADAYDADMTSKGSPKRAFRGGGRA